MTKATISISALTTSNQTKKYNLGYANPDATDAKLLQLAQKVNGLTSNTLVKVEKQLVTDISNTFIPYTAKIVSTSDFFSTDPTTWQTFMYAHIIEPTDYFNILNFGAPYALNKIKLDNWINANPNFQFENFIEDINNWISTKENPPTLTAKNGELYFEFQSNNRLIFQDETTNAGIVNDIWNKTADKTYITMSNIMITVTGTRD